MKYTTNLINKLSNEELGFWLRAESDVLTYAQKTVAITSECVGALTYEIERRQRISAKADLKYLLGLTTDFHDNREPFPFDFIRFSRSTLFELFEEIQSETSNTPEDLKTRFTAFEKDVAKAAEEYDGELLF